MNKLEELLDFSSHDGHIPCILCKGESSMTIVGNHWKCSVCAHIFNQDGSDIGVECYCETCRAKKEAMQDVTEEKIQGALQKLAKAIKKASKKKKK